MLQVEPVHGEGDQQLVAHARGVDPNGAYEASPKLLHHQGPRGDVLSPTGSEEHGGLPREREERRTQVTVWFDQV